jgi:hypothetical protein
VRALALLAALALAACGANGPPEPVGDRAGIDAEATIGVTERF